jgi:hypothetical protein
MALVLLQGPWLARPVHYDEANFLVLARGAVADPWRPHAAMVNWQGVRERAFDVLSNPPGIAWWLAPVAHLPVVVQRAWMLPWLAPALWGAWRLGQRFGPAGQREGATGAEVARAGERAALVLLTSPIVFLSTAALLPDAPLYALTLAGVGGFVHAVDRERTTTGWALLAGCAALFRYSGGVLVPVLALYAIRRGRSPLLAVPALLPLGALALHDLHAYGELHLLAMGRFQSVANAPLDLAHKAVASVCMLGGAAALPIFPWTRRVAVGAALGGLAALPWGAAAAGFGLLGGAALASVLDNGDAAPRDRRWLLAWAVLGMGLLLALRFTATRYWLPFLPAVLLSFPSGRWTRRTLAVQLSLGVLLAADEDRSARAQEDLARQVARVGTGGFTGHWGWQWQLEQRGWTALDEGTRPAPGALVAIPREAWPQPVEVGCSRIVWEGFAQPQLPWLPRGYSSEAGANLHASWIAGPPPVRTVKPWGFANDPYEQVRVCRE